MGDPGLHEDGVLAGEAELGDCVQHEAGHQLEHRGLLAGGHQAAQQLLRHTGHDGEVLLTGARS